MAMERFTLASRRLAPPSPFGAPMLGGTDIDGRSFGDRLLDLGFGTAQDIIRGGIAGTEKKPLVTKTKPGLDAIPGLTPLVATGEAGTCPGLFSVRGPDGRCINLGSALPGGDPFISEQVTDFGDGAGAAVLGRFGAALVPIAEGRIRRRCLPGMVLGRDNLCYDKGAIRKSDRKWVPGTAPLLTGGEVRATRIAASASKKLARKVKSLQAAGLFPKPAPRRPAQKALPAPQVVVVDTD